MNIGQTIVGIAKIAPAVSSSFRCIKAKIIHGTLGDKIAVLDYLSAKQRGAVHHC